MTTCHLITYADLTLLTDIDFSHLDDTVRQLITDGEVEFLALELRIHLLIFSNIVDDALCHEFVLMLICSPTFEEHGEEIDLVQTLLAEMLTLSDEFRTEDILDGNSLTTVEQVIELVDEKLTEFLCFLAELEIHLLQRLFILHLLLAVFVSTAVQFLIDDHTIE